MCGIGLVFNDVTIEKCNGLNELLKNRGPDGTNSVKVFDAYLMASILHIQGIIPTYQPYEDEYGNILLWNGEMFSGLSSKIIGVSDTKLISDALHRTCSTDDLSDRVSLSIVQCLSSINGPYSFIYYHKRTSTVYFGRDPFGRRSLVAFAHGNTLFALSSVVVPDFVDEVQSDLCEKAKWEELSIDGIYSVKIGIVGQKTFNFACKWPSNRIRLTRRFNLVSKQNDFVSFSKAELFLSVLKMAVRDRVLSLNCPHAVDFQNSAVPKCRIGLLFSGGIDSVVLAAVLHLSMPVKSENEPIELINVCFKSSSSTLTCDDDSASSSKYSPDRLAAILSLRELKTLFPSREWRLVCVDVDPVERQLHEDRVKGLILPRDTLMDLNIGTAFWFAARGSGYLLRDDQCKLQDLDLTGLRHADVLHPTINEDKTSHDGVAEENEGCGTVGCKRPCKRGCCFNCCKRCCDMKRTAETVCKAHKISAKQLAKMIENKSRRDAWLKSQNCTTTDTPLDTVETAVHETLAECSGSVESSVEDYPPVESTPDHAPIDTKSSEEIPYVCSCRVLLVGIGADEQLAGYARHRTVFQTGGITALFNEMNTDLQRLWMRNLGRDDRCISDHGKEAWFPYLDEHVVSFLQQLPLSQIADLTLPQGVGDKLILRNAAKMLGLKQCTSLVKRAIQFGTGIAKHTNLLYNDSNRKGCGLKKM